MKISSVNLYNRLYFAELDESGMNNEVKSHLMATMVNGDKNMVDHPTYNTRVLARLSLRSMTDDFSITNINCVPQDFCIDGPFVLWTICNNIHRVNVAFVQGPRDLSFKGASDNTPAKIPPNTVASSSVPGAIIAS